MGAGATTAVACECDGCARTDVGAFGDGGLSGCLCGRRGCRIEGRGRARSKRVENVIARTALSCAHTGTQKATPAISETAEAK